jgi:type II secretory pathway component PulF
MPIFEYQGLDATGKTVKGTVSGASVAAAQQTLETRGLQVQFVQLVGLPQHQLHPVPVSVPNLNQSQSGGGIAKLGPGGAGNAPTNMPTQKTIYSNVSMPDLVVSKQVQGVAVAALEQYMRQCSLLLRAGINAHEAFEDLSRRPLKALLKQVSKEVAHEAVQGRNIADVFDRYPGAFSPFIRAMVRAGETGGFLPKAMEDIADTLEQEIEIRNRVRMATIYPKLLFVFALIIVLTINSFARGLIGRDLYQSPVLTIGFWMVAGPILIAAILYFRYGVRIPAIKKNYDLIVSYIPVIGTTNRMFAMAKFGQTFGALMNAGVLPAESLELAANSMGNEHLADRIRPGVEPLRQGYGITATLQATGVFPSSLLHMMATGEKTGQMDEMMRRASEYFRGEAKVRAQQMGVFLGILVLVLVVLWIASMIFGVMGGISGQYQEVIKETTQ